MLDVIGRLLRWKGLRADVTIGPGSDPYLLRWHILPRNPIFNVYLHLFLRSDDDRALHDHPYWNLSILLEGEYAEHTIEAGGVNKRTIRQAGDVKFRLGRAAHRIEMTQDHCWTLFITGPRFRDWGFHCAKAGWISHEDFVAFEPGGAAIVGKGCGEFKQ